MMLCTGEILIILSKAGINGLTKEQIILIHYLLKNPENATENSLLQRANRLKIFDICDYDLLIESLIRKEIVESKILRVIAKYILTEKGKLLVGKLNNEHISKLRSDVEQIFKDSITEKNLRRRIIPHVHI